MQGADGAEKPKKPGYESGRPADGFESGTDFEQSDTDDYQSTKAAYSEPDFERKRVYFNIVVVGRKTRVWREKGTFVPATG